MTPEGAVKKALKQRLNELGAYHFWPVQTGFGTFTVDCVGCYQGKFFAVETKAPGKKLTLRQQLVLSAMAASGGMTFVVSDVETARAFTFAFRDPDIQTE